MRCPGGYYPLWRKMRIMAIMDTLGVIRDKNILELGCGDGSIGNFFYYLGNTVTCCDARPECLEEVRTRNQAIRTVQADLNDQWPFDEHFDIILHLGTLYHLDVPAFSLQKCCEFCDQLILDTEITGGGGESINSLSENPPVKYAAEIEFNDHAFDGKLGDTNASGCRPTVKWVESILTINGFEATRYTDDKYDDLGVPQTIGWKDDLNGWINGRRALWFCERDRRE